MAAKTVLKFKDKDGSIIVPLTEVKAGSNISVVRDKDVDNNPIDSVTISASSNTYSAVPNQTHIDGSNNIGLSDNLVLPGKKISFAGAMTDLTGLQNYSLFFQDVTI